MMETDRYSELLNRIIIREGTRINQMSAAKEQQHRERREHSQGKDHSRSDTKPGNGPVLGSSGGYPSGYRTSSSSPPLYTGHHDSQPGRDPNKSSSSLPKPTPPPTHQDPNTPLPSYSKPSVPAHFQLPLSPIGDTPPWSLESPVSSLNPTRTAQGASGSHQQVVAVLMRRSPRFHQEVEDYSVPLQRESLLLLPNPSYLICCPPSSFPHARGK